MKFYTTETLDENVFFRNQEGMRKPNLNFVPTFEEMQEYTKCSTNPFYFFEKYCKVLTPNGNSNIKLREYQKLIIKDFFNHRFNITASSRQTGMSTLEVLLIIFESIFKSKISIVIDNKSTAQAEKMDKIRLIYKQLPFFLKPGVVSSSKTKIEFENGSKILGIIHTKNAIGHSIDNLFIDEFSFLSDTFMKALLPALVPAVSSKIFIITSSMDPGILFKNAERKEGDPKKNLFNARRIYWWEVDGRNDQWKQEMIKMVGSETEFDQEFDFS